MSAPESISSSLLRRVRVGRHESELGSWIEIQCFPHPVLAQHVEMIFYSEGIVHYTRDRILPRGLPHLLINLGPPQYLVQGVAREEFSDLWFSGQQETYLETEAPQGATIMGVVFRPFGAYPVIGLDQDSLCGEVVSLAALLGDQVHRLREQLLNGDDAFSRLSIVEGWLSERISRGRPVHLATRWVAESLAESEGQTKIQDLEKESGYSRKYLIRLLRREVGLTPKALARIYRFHGFLDRLHDDPHPRWSALAAECGYYDQSHLIREVRTFTGITPRQLLNAPSPDGLTLALR